MLPQRGCPHSTERGASTTAQASASGHYQRRFASHSPAIVEYQTVEYNLAKNPVVIQVKISKGTKWLYILAVIPLLLLCALGIVAFEVLAAIVVMSHWSTGTFTSSDILQALVVVGIGIATIWGAILISRYLPTILGKPYGVTFGPDGVSYRSYLGRQTFLRWAEIHLFEASGTPRFGHISPPYQYWLYGLHKAVNWRDSPVYPTAESLPTPLSTPGGTALVVTIIHDRTVLAPRTFVKPLQAKESPAV